MALGDPYATLADLKGYIPALQVSTSDDALLTGCLSVASVKVEEYCDRQFNLAPTESSRVYGPTDDVMYVETDDFVYTAGFTLKTDPGGTGNFDNVWSYPLDFELLPLNNLFNGRYRPYNEIHATSGRWFPVVPLRRRGTVQVTAQWGWPSVPNPIHQATMMIASELYRSKEAPFGVAGFNQAGQAYRVRENPLICELLDPFVSGTGSNLRIG